MTSIQNKIQENKAKGESFTESILLKSFWVLKRSIDFGGADFLIEERSENFNKQISIFGIVQAKFFEGRTQVKISRSYVEDSFGPKKNFFVFVHTLNEVGDVITYFFIGDEIVKNWALTKSKNDFYFSITKKNDFFEYRNLSNFQIVEQIKNGLNRTSTDSINFILRNFFNVYVDTRKCIPKPNFINYIFKIVEDCKIVICHDLTSGGKTLLESRRDIFNYTGEFEWGYFGEGPKFLSASLIGHYYGGVRTPSYIQICKFARQLALKDRNSEFSMTSKEIDKLFEEDL